ncbi:hypothetical protein HPG69_018439, partial [Diceros bicornis minor]
MVLLSVSQWTWEACTAHLHYQWIPAEDSHTTDISSHFQEAIDFIDCVRGKGGKCPPTPQSQSSAEAPGPWSHPAKPGMGEPAQPHQQLGFFQTLDISYLCNTEDLTLSHIRDREWSPGLQTNFRLTLGIGSRDQRK